MPKLIRSHLKSQQLISLISLLFLVFACSPAEEYDILLRNGTIVDGSGQDAYTGDVAINGSKIVAIGNLRKVMASQEIDATDLVIAPGFINIHSHAQAEALPTAINMLSQGVTTEIMNADGRSPLNLNQQMESLDSAGLALNVGGMIGFNSVWHEVVGTEDKRPDETQIQLMQSKIQQGLEDGAWGVSAGLDYVPGYYATTEEVITILQPFKDWKVVFSNHDRLTPESNFSSIAGMSETIEIGEASGLIPLITHMKVQGWEQGKANIILEKMNNAKKSSPQGAVADVYPYLAGQTGLAALIIPSWAQAGGYDKMIERFQDPSQRAKIIQEAEKAMELRFGGPSGVLLLDSQRELLDAMKSYEINSPGETVIRLLEEKNQGIIARFGKESDLVEIMQHPTASIACDCGASTSERGHPRGWGSFPKVLGEFVRIKKVLSIEQAVHKMSGLPAQTIGMKDRGLLQEGMIADLTIFNPATVIDHATYEKPTLISEGIIHTIINGQFVWKDGAATGTKAGQTLKRQKPF